MATIAQIRANRDNAQHSTGPRTEKGKARAASNSARHGFCSQTVLLPGDDPAEYQQLLDELTDHFGPVEDLTDQRCVREMADAEWRLRRVRQYIEETLTASILRLAPENPGLSPIALQALAFDTLCRERSSGFTVLMRYETKFERQYDRAYNAWSTYQEAQDRCERRRQKMEVDAIFAAPPPSRARTVEAAFPNEADSRRIPDHAPATAASAAAATAQPAFPNGPNSPARPVVPAVAAVSATASKPAFPNEANSPGSPATGATPRNAPCPGSTGPKISHTTARWWHRLQSL